MSVTFLYFLLFLFSTFTFTQTTEKIEVVKLKEGVYIYQSFGFYEGERVSANGLIVESTDKVALIDTPWDEQQTIQLLDWIEAEIEKPVVFAVITHAHLDRIAGIDVLRSRKIPAISGHLTAKEAAKKGIARPGITFQSDTLLT